MQIARGDAVALARALIKIDSRNPTLVPNAPGEGECARFLAEVLGPWGFDVELVEAAPDRPNVVARIGGKNSAASSPLILNGHLDVVGIEAMSHSPFEAEVRRGCIYGRGSADMKAGVAAMCAAALLASESGSRPIVIAAVVDEEYESLGTRALLERGLSGEAAIITEPTRLAICPAHRGFVWLDITFRGRAAHGSRYELGVDAITHAGLVLAELHALEKTREEKLRHTLLGRGSLHASMIRGGVGMSTYPEECVLAIERRTLPGEDETTVLREIQEVCDRVRAENASLDARITLKTSQLPSDVSTDSPVVRNLANAIQKEGLPVAVEGMSAWTDAALFNAAGIPTVCFGPGDIAFAHAAEEFVPIPQIEQATRVLHRVLSEWN